MVAYFPVQAYSNRSQAVEALRAMRGDWEHLCTVHQGSTGTTLTLKVYRSGVLLQFCVFLPMVAYYPVQAYSNRSQAVEALRAMHGDWEHLCTVHQGSTGTTLTLKVYRSGVLLPWGFYDPWWHTILCRPIQTYPRL